MSSQPFRVVLRGYDPIEVDKRHAELVAALEAAQAEAERTTNASSDWVQERETLLSKVAEREQQVGLLREQAARADVPTYRGLGERVTQILALAEDEAAELRATAKADAERFQAEVEESGKTVRTDADTYASETRGQAEAEAAQVVNAARAEADSIIDAADREANTRRQEGEAYYEQARARASAAAADFEQTLAERREKAAVEFRSHMAQQQKGLAEVQSRTDALSSAAEQKLREAQQQAALVTSNAQREADEILSAARSQAEQLKRASDRELAAAAARRDSIGAQLANVRHMLATVSTNQASPDAVAREIIANPFAEVSTVDAVPARSELNEPVQHGHVAVTVDEPSVPEVAPVQTIEAEDADVVVVVVDKD